jgi:hypothetical protein
MIFSQSEVLKRAGEGLVERTLFNINELLKKCNKIKVGQCRGGRGMDNW